MNSRRRFLYDVVEWPGFEEAAILALGSFGRWEAVKEYLDLFIARDPKVGHLIPGTNLYALSLETNPPCTIFYSIEDESIDEAGHQTGKIVLREIEEV